MSDGTDDHAEEDDAPTASAEEIAELMDAPVENVRRSLRIFDDRRFTHADEAAVILDRIEELETLDDDEYLTVEEVADGLGIDLGDADTIGQDGDER